MRPLSLIISALLACCLFAEKANAQSGDAKAGEAAFDVCSTCHTATKGEGSEIGPNLFGVVGRKAASVSDFTYSAPMKASGITWTSATLAVWLADPAKMVPGTSMGFPGMTNEQKIRDLIAYLETLK